MLSAFYELLKSTATLSTFFILYDVWNAFCRGVEVQVNLAISKSKGSCISKDC